MKSTVALVILAISLSTSTGCTTMSDVGADMRRSVRMFRPRPFDETTEEEEEELVDDWGKMMSEARQPDQREPDSDSWWWNKVMSPQSRSIERSLGVGQ